MTATRLLPSLSPSLAQSSNSYAPGVSNEARVRGSSGALKLTVPGPLSIRQVVTRVPARAHEHGSRGRLSRAHEAAGIDARRRRNDGGVRRNCFQDRRHVGAHAPADRVVQATLRPVIRSVHLKLPVYEAGAVLDHLRGEPIRPADNEDDREIADPRWRPIRWESS